MKRVHEVLDEVQRLERQLTVFRDDSEVSLLNREADQHPVKAEAGLFALLQLALRLHRETGGAFDITAGSLTRAWKFLTREGQVPAPEELEQARARVGSQWIQLEEDQHTVFFSRPGLEINLGSIGKGYALDRVLEGLKEGGFTDFLVHAGHSSVLACGDTPGGCGWKVSIRHPLDKSRDFAALQLYDQAMSTSGIGEQFFLSDGKRYGHILDPRNGWPPGHHVSATAVAPTAAEADALSTAFFIMSTEEVEAFCRTHPGVGAVLIPAPETGGSCRVHRFGLEKEQLEVWI